MAIRWKTSDIHEGVVIADMKHEAVIKIDVQYGTDFQEKTWEKAIEIALISVREIMEKAHKDNRLDWGTFVKP